MVFQWIWVQKPLLAMVFNGFWSPKPLIAMVFQWFPMVANHWSDDGMVTIHRSGLNVFVGVIVQASFSFCVFVLRILLKQDTALLSHVSQSVSVCVTGVTSQVFSII